MASQVATGVIDLFLHPPPRAMHLETIPGAPFEGLNAFFRQRLNVRTDAYGIRWVITAFPPGYGVTPIAGGNRFDRDVIDIAVTHELFDGTLQTTDEASFRSASGYLLFNQVFPWNVQVELAPGIQASLWWMVVFP